MKVQFSSRRLRIRVDHAEFGALRSAGRLVLAFPAEQGPWHVEVAAGPARELAVGGGRIRLQVPLAELDALAVRLPCRDGIRGRFHVAGSEVEVALEVDVRDRSPPRPR